MTDAESGTAPAPQTSAPSGAETAWSDADRARWCSPSVLRALDQVPAAVLVTDCQLRVHVLNEAVRTKVGPDWERLVGTTMGEALPREEVRAYLPYARAALAGVAQQFQRTKTDRNGEVRHTQVSYAPHRSDDGQVRGLVIHIVDITDRVATESALRQQAERAAAERERSLLAAMAQDKVTRPLFAATLELSATLHDGGSEARRRVAAAIASIDAAIGDLRRVILRPKHLDADGEAVIGADVGDARHSAAQALTAELVATNVADLITIADGEGRCSWASPSAVWVTGWLPEQLVGRRRSDLVHPEDRSMVSGRLAQLGATASSVTMEYRYQRPDGSYLWVEDTVRGLAGPDGEAPATTITNTRDVTERFRLQTALAESAEVFELCFTAAPIGMALVAPDGHWLKVNPALTAITGRTEAELLAGDFQEITHPEDLNADLALLREVTNGTRTGYQLDKRYLRADGSTVLVQLNVAAVRDASGQLRFLISQILERSRSRREESG